MTPVARSLAVSVMPLENRREQFVTLATLAERLGYEAMLLPETWAYDVTIVLAEAAVKTQRLTVGSAILGVWNRSAATLAMGAATLASLSGGRFILGLGASTPQLVEGLHDVPFGPPLARMRQMVTQVLERLREGAARARRATLPVVYPLIPASVDDDAARAREGAAWLVSFYLTSMGTFYRDTLIRFGFDKEVQAVLAANTPKFAAAVPPEADVLLDELIVYGTPAEARRRLARWYAAGAT